MKKLGSKLLALSFLVMSFGSCVKNPVDFASVSSDKLQILYTIPDQVPGSYATVGAYPSERLFDEAYVLFYDDSGTYVAHSSSNQSAESSVGSFEVTKPAKVELGKQYKLLVVANMKYYLDKTKYATTNDYLNDKKTVGYETMRSEISATSTNRISGHLPMYAHQNITIAEATIVSVKFERSVARFDLVSLAQDLDIEWVKVCNYSNAGYFYHNDYNVVNSSIVNGAGVNDLESPQHKVFLARRASLADKTVPQSNANGGLYSFPNINTNTGVNDQKTTCLLFKGTYSYTEGGVLKTKDGYYRVNISAPNKPQNLKRNNIYRITVKSVTDGGADNEDGAMKNSTVNVNYEINDWTVDNSQEIITDDKGNYLGVQPALAYIGAYTGSSLTGTIKVKEGASWEIEKLEPADDWFSVAKTADGHGFILTALKENKTPNYLSSKVRVKLTGTDLQFNISVYQYSATVSKDVLLVIDGRMGDFSVDVNKNGEKYNFPVLLGNSNASATMTWESGPKDMILSSDPIIGSPNAIGNNSTLALTLSANATDARRSSTYKIVRSDGLNPNIESRITFSQDPTTDLLIVSPTQLFDKGTVDGFMNRTGVIEGRLCYKQVVTVRSRDAKKYPKWKATCSFKGYDASLTNSLAANIDYPIGGWYPNVTGGNGESFQVLVSRCGPGDAPLYGTITIEGCDAAGKVVPGATYVFPLKIQSSSKSGFTQIDKILFHDRNVGALDYSITDESMLSPALPFCNYSADYQSQLDEYKLFKGGYFNFSDARSQCPLGWRMPTSTEFETINNLLQWCKGGGRPYIIANQGSGKDVKGCYFPLSGDDKRPGETMCYYFSSTTHATQDLVYALKIDYNSSMTTYIPKAVTKNLVRCVKDVL